MTVGVCTYILNAKRSTTMTIRCFRFIILNSTNSLSCARVRIGGCVNVRGGRTRISCDRYYHGTSHGFGGRERRRDELFGKQPNPRSENLYIYIGYNMLREEWWELKTGGVSLFILLLRYEIKTTKRSITQLMSRPNKQSYSSKIALYAHIYIVPSIRSL